MKPKVLVTREIFEDVLEYLRQHFQVTDNQRDTPMDAEALAKNLANKTGVMTTLVDRVDAKLLSGCPKLKAVCNIAVGFNNIDLAACSKAGVMANEHARGPGRKHCGLHLGLDSVHGPPGGRVRRARAIRTVEGLVSQAVPGQGRTSPPPSGSSASAESAGG